MRRVRTRYPAMTALLVTGGALVVAAGLSATAPARGATGGNGLAGSAAVGAATPAPVIFTDNASVTPDPMIVGAGAAYRAEVRNTSASTATDVMTVITITDNGAASGGLTFGALPAGCTATGAQVVTCTAAAIAAGATAGYDIPITVNPSLDDGVNFRLEASTSDAAGDTGGTAPGGLITQAHTSVDVAITKTGPAAVGPDGTITYTITVVNHGPSDSPSTTWHDDTNGNLTTITSYPCGDTGLTVSCSLGTMGPGETITKTITVRVNPDVPAGTVIPDCAVVYTGKPDTDESNNNSCIDTVVTAPGEPAPPSAVLSIVKTGPAAVMADGSITYTDAVTDLGPGSATNVTFSDPLDPLLAAVTSLPAGCSVADRTVTCALGTLAAGETRTLAFAATLAPGAVAGTAIMNCASADSDTVRVIARSRDAPPASCVETDVLPPPRADIGVTKTGPVSVAPDGTFTYLLQVTNHGPGDAADVTVDDPLDESVVSVVPPLPAGCATAAGTVTCHLGTMATSEIKDLDITVRARSGDADGTVIENCAQAYTATDDPDIGNNESCAGTVVSVIPLVTPPAAGLVLVKDGPEQAFPGETLTYAVGVANLGPHAAKDVRVTDPLDASLVTPAALPDGCSADDGTVTCQAGTLAAGQTKAFLIEVVADPGIPPGTPVDNCAAASSSTTLLRGDPGSWCTEAIVAALPSVPVTG